MKCFKSSLGRHIAKILLASFALGFQQTAFAEPGSSQEIKAIQEQTEAIKAQTEVIKKQNEIQESSEMSQRKETVGISIGLLGIVLGLGRVAAAISKAATGVLVIPNTVLKEMEHPGQGNAPEAMLLPAATDDFGAKASGHTTPVPRTGTVLVNSTAVAI